MFSLGVHHSGCLFLARARHSSQFFFFATSSRAFIVSSFLWGVCLRFCVLIQWLCQMSPSFAAISHIPGAGWGSGAPASGRLGDAAVYGTRGQVLDLHQERVRHHHEYLPEPHGHQLLLFVLWYTTPPTKCHTHQIKANSCYL